MVFHAMFNEKIKKFSDSLHINVSSGVLNCSALLYFVVFTRGLGKSLVYKRLLSKKTSPYVISKCGCFTFLFMTRSHNGKEGHVSIADKEVQTLGHGNTN